MNKTFLLVIAVFFAGSWSWALPSDGPSASKWENFPILAYDSDTGFGFGAKSFLLNGLGTGESVDATLYASTLGERWARLVVSHPDFGLRQGTVYPLSLDFKFEYDRMIRNHFFGLGNRSNSGDRETYNKEPLTFEMTASHSVSKKLVFDAGVRYRHIEDSRPLPGGLLEKVGAPSVGLVEYASAFAGVAFNTCDVFLNPHRGWILEGEVESSPFRGGESVRYDKWETTFRRYCPLDLFHSVAAFRIQLQGLDRRDLPVQTLLSLGGGSTLRGFAQDRFMDSALALANAEWRFPIYKRLGGVAGCDAGKVWDSFSEADWSRWAVNAVSGLRFYMDTFTVRVDLGWSREGTGLYLNFDQVI